MSFAEAEMKKDEEYYRSPASQDAITISNFLRRPQTVSKWPEWLHTDPIGDQAPPSAASLMTYFDIAYNRIEKYILAGEDVISLCASLTVCPM